MNRSKLSVVIAGAALSVGGLALAPMDAAAHATTSTPVTGVCFRVFGVGHHYAVVATPCGLIERMPELKR